MDLLLGKTYETNIDSFNAENKHVQVAMVYFPHIISEKILSSTKMQRILE